MAQVSKPKTAMEYKFFEKRDFFSDKFSQVTPLELEPQTIPGTFVLGKNHKIPRGKKWPRFSKPETAKEYHFHIEFGGGGAPPKSPLYHSISTPFRIDMNITPY